MKKLIVSTAAIVCLIATQSCNNSAKTETKKEEHSTKAAHSVNLLRSSVHVPLAEAKDNIMRYNNTCIERFGTVPIKAYTINAIDMLEVLGLEVADSICKYKHARAYLGLDSLYRFKLYLTPVDSADLSAVPILPGKDVILTDKYGYYVLDLNAPCPMTCDFTSPLYYEGSMKKHE
jgi:hypothetical protein